MSQTPAAGPAGGPEDPRAFATTEWSVVLAAGATDAGAARPALERLCATYWYPLYAFVRRRGHDAARAEDLTQAFFARLLDTDMLRHLDRDKGRFRSFLLACLRHFLSNERDRERAAKRGGGKRIASLDTATAEARYAREPAHDLTPERLFERRWALTLLESVLATLRAEYAADGRDAVFDACKGYIAGDGGPPYAEVAAALDTTEGAIKVAVHRMRKRFAEALRAEVARIVEDPSDVDGELGALLDALGTSG